MTARMVERIVAATLYEGYILYPYRPTSVKNQVRWTFGGVHPRAYSEASGGTEPWTAQTECLLRAGDAATVDVLVRFLQLVTRSVVDAEMRPVPELRVGDVTHRAWEEAVERTIECGVQRVAALLDHPLSVDAVVPGGRDVEPLRNESGEVVGSLVRERDALTTEVTVVAERDGGDLIRIRVVVRNVSDTELTGAGDRERALRRSLISTHAILVAGGAGRWLSLADPPVDARDAATRCVNTGMWPVLVGDPDVDDTVLASPIILDDHPRVAPESAGDLFDATEIDEILSLRILTLTEAEKAEVRAADARARAVLDRTESLTQEDLMRLHGTIRELRPARGNGE